MDYRKICDANYSYTYSKYNITNFIGGEQTNVTVHQALITKKSK
jgi:hypothetical protein